ncbi:phage portal protein [Streptococcus cameli]
MGILNNFFGFFSSNKSEVKTVSKRELEAMIARSGQRIQVMEYALQLCIDRIANALSLADFETYDKKKLSHGQIWWRFNYEPNQNQTLNQFLAGVIGEMVRNPDGALVLLHNDEFILATNFEVTYRAFKPNIYHNIVVSGGFKMDRVYLEEDVLHFTFNDSKIKAYLDDLYSEYGKLIGGAIRNYNRGNALKLGLNIKTLFDQQFGNKVVDKDEDGNDITEADQIIDEMYENRFAAVLSDKDSITPLEEGLEITNLVNTSANTKSGAVTTRDIADVISDVINLAADAFNIPRGILKGDVADAEAMRDNFVNFGVRPWADIIETEVNRKLYGHARVKEGSKFKIQTNSILVYNLEKFASSAEGLFRIGVYNRDEIRRKLGEEEINDKTSRDYYVTKNYQSENQMMKGGEES